MPLPEPKQKSIFPSNNFILQDKNSINGAGCLGSLLALAFGLVSLSTLGIFIWVKLSSSGSGQGKEGQSQVKVRLT